MNSRIFLALLIFFAGCNSSPITSSLSATESVTGTDVIYFPETGHSTRPPFSTYYKQHNGFNRLGLPITEVVTSDGWQVQYFQYGRLEIHPENQPEYYVTVGWLGSLEHRTQPPLVASPCYGCLFYRQTGHTISGDFLRYFEANGDTVQFGLPLSEPFMHDGLLTQDFQSARFLWRPDHPASARVQLEPLGETYFLNNGLPLTWLNPVAPPVDAEIHITQSISLPPQTKTRLSIEETANPAVIRVVATFFVNSLPVKGYVPWLSQDGQLIPLPPTRSGGQTHLLITLDDRRATTFSLLDHTQELTLSSTVYE